MEKNLEKSPKILFALFCAPALFFSSCAKKVGVVDDGSSNTLRYQIEQMLDDFQWSEELEPGRLSEDVSRYGNISDKVRMSPLAILCSMPEPASDGGESEIGGAEGAVYPYIAGFGLLDVSKTPKTVLSSATGFCDSIVGGTDADSFVSKSCLYSLALFLRELESLKTDKKIPSVSSYVIASSFSAGTSYEVPVRFYDSEKKNFLDVALYFSEEAGSWKIDQIHIVKTNTPVR